MKNGLCKYGMVRWLIAFVIAEFVLTIVAYPLLHHRVGMATLIVLPFALICSLILYFALLRPSKDYHED